MAGSTPVRRGKGMHEVDFARDATACNARFMTAWMGAPLTTARLGHWPHWRPRHQASCQCRAGRAPRQHTAKVVDCEDISIQPLAPTASGCKTTSRSVQRMERAVVPCNP